MKNKYSTSGKILLIVIQIVIICSIVFNGDYSYADMDIRAQENMKKEENIVESRENTREREDTEAQENIKIEDELSRKDFRFVTVEKNMGFFQKDLDIYEEMNDMSRKVGQASGEGLCYILKKVGEWLYIESGDVRGFVKSSDIIQNDEAQKKMNELVSESEGRISITLDIDSNGNIEENTVDTSYGTLLNLATPLLDPQENAALSYTKTTIQETVVKKQYLISKNAVCITENKDEITRIIGILPENGLAFCILEEDGWYYVESGDVRGFAKMENFRSKETSEQEAQLEKYPLAQEKIDPTENQNLYYSFASVQEGNALHEVREAMVTYSQKVEELENEGKYSTLLESKSSTEFMQGIYKEYGYSIPETKEEQVAHGNVIPINEVKPGDLVFLADGDGISEPLMYAGSEKLLKFTTLEKKSILIALKDTKKNRSVWAVDLLSPKKEIEDYSEKANLGRFKLTAYCSCAKCCGKWSGGPTTSGMMPVEGRTVAMGGIPIGTSLLINGKVYLVEDRGTSYGHVDVYMNNHEACLEFGVEYAEVYKVQ